MSLNPFVSAHLRIRIAALGAPLTALVERVVTASSASYVSLLPREVTH